VEDPPGRGAAGMRIQDRPWYPVVFMVVLSAVFGAAVSTVEVFSLPRQQAGEQARLRSRVLQAFGVDAPSDPVALAGVWKARVVEGRDEVGPYYALRERGRVKGYAFPFEAPGFWGAIFGVVAVDARAETILGISFLRHEETPGLGGRISEAWFRDQFRGKSLEVRDGRVLEFVFRPPRGPREVEAITGATQTSNRLGGFLNEFLAGLPQRPVFRRKGDG